MGFNSGFKGLMLKLQICARLTVNMAAICLVGWALRSRGSGQNYKYRPEHTIAALGGWDHLKLICGIRWVCDALLCIRAHCNL